MFKKCNIDLKYHLGYLKGRPDYRGLVLLNIARFLYNKFKTKIIFECANNAKILLNNTKDFPYYVCTKKDNRLSLLDGSDLYLSFNGDRFKIKRKFAHNNDIPYLVYDAFGLPDAIFLDKIGLYNNSCISNKINKLIQSYDDTYSLKYRKFLINLKYSKRIQKNESLPKVGKYIFFPGQALRDVTLTEFGINILEYLNRLLVFCKDKDINIVFKPHPGLNDSRRHGKEIINKECNRLLGCYNNFFVKQNQMYMIYKK